MDGEGFYRALVAIETDATRYHGANATRPGLLGVTDAEQMLAHIAADIQNLLPEISNCSLIAAGALFDQTQILSPAYPVFSALEAVPASGGFKPGLVSIGAENGKMPVADLQPRTDIPLGLLQLLPLVIHGPSSLVEELGQAMEYRFMEEGQLSAHSAAWLETAFDISINHARLMTSTDLSAMLRMQLEHFGFLPMWELVDAALSGTGEAVAVMTDSGKEYEWKGNAVHTSFETFDHWASRGGGARSVATRQALAAGYAEWSREVRQYITTLRAHGLKVRFHLASDGSQLDGTFFSEESSIVPGANDSAITEHSYGELGTIAVTFFDGNRVVNYYPLRPQGLNDIHSHLRSRLTDRHTVAFPGSVLYDEKARKLVPDTGVGSR
jgi:hypothetical protein